MAKNWREARLKSEKITRRYQKYHAGTAVLAGALGGKFGFDRIPLTMLTISMISEICEVYGITEPLPVTIHIISAIARLTYKGTLAGMALNWLPGGSLVNGGVTYVLTSDCAHECMSDIEKGRMGSVEQLLLAFGRSTVTFACELLGKAGNKVSGEIVDSIRESLEVTAPMDNVKAVLGSSITGTAMSVLSGDGLPSLREFLLSTVPAGVLNVSFTELARKNGSFVDNRNSVVWRLEQMRTGVPAFKAFDSQLDEWITKTRRTPDYKGLWELVKILDKEFSEVLGCSVPGKLAGKSASWAIANNAGSIARERGFHTASC